MEDDEHGMGMGAIAKWGLGEAARGRRLEVGWGAGLEGREQGAWDGDVRGIRAGRG